MLRSVTLCKVLTMTFLWTPCPLGHPPTSFSQQSVLSSGSTQDPVSNCVLFYQSCPLGLGSVTKLCLTLWDAMDCSTPGFPLLQLPEPAQTYVLNWWWHPTILFLCRPFLLLPSIFPSIRVFSNELALCISWQSIGTSAPASVLPMNTELIFFRTDLFDLWAVQRTLKNLLQHHSLRASILWHSAFLYGPTLTFTHDSQINHSFDYRDLCWQSAAFAF